MAQVLGNDQTGKVKYWPEPYRLDKPGADTPRVLVRAAILGKPGLECAHAE